MAVSVSGQLLSEDLLGLPETLPIGPEDSRSLLERLAGQAGAARTSLLPRALQLGIQRFGVTGSIQDSATAVRDLCASEMERQEAELSIIRYIAWAIPQLVLLVPSAVSALLWPRQIVPSKGTSQGSPSILGWLSIQPSLPF